MSERRLNPSGSVQFTSVAAPTGTASLTLAITAKVGRKAARVDYRIRPQPGHDPARGRFAWTVAKLGSPDRYDVHATADVATCSCPDSTYRARDCRHLLACRKLGLIP